MDGVRELGLLTYNFDVHGHKRRFANNSLFLLNTKNPFRYYLVWIVEWKWFDRFILLCIVANSIILAFRDYQDPGSITDADGTYYPNLRNSIVEKSETIFSWIFFAECVMKIVAMGFVLGRGAYLRSYWNQLDFFVVVVGFIGDLPGIPKVSALRTARVLRPLRTLSNLRGMRILIYALFSALPALFNVMVIIGFVFTVFGILGVLIWNGALHYRCRETPEPINGTWLLAGEGRLCGGQYKCAVGEYCGSVYSLPPNTTIDFSKLPPSESWDYKFSGFDNIGFALLTLFQSITLEGWTVVMYNFQDAHNWTFASLYFVTFTIIGAFFILQFVFAVIWERFNAVNDGTADNWDLILAERKSNTNTRTTTKLVVCILLNTVCLAMDEYPVDPARTLVTENLNVVLTIIFSGEMAFKVIGLGPREYCSDNYNLFDGVIVLISLIELLFNFVNPDSKNNTGLSALRSFRFFRIMKLARSWRSLRELLVTIGNSILDVANFGLLLLLLMYVFALIGMQFFANKYRFNADGDPVEWQPHVFNTTTPPHAPWTPENPYTIRRSNFDDTLAAFTTVFQCLTEESWNFVMYDGVRSTGWGALLYFLAVMIIGNIIILNLFLAILLGNFSLDEQQTEMETAMIKGQQKLMDAIQIGPIRKLSSTWIY
uniref:Ion transport domain-containing protein n=1 Tax=Globisporangium ultimum (strain ATCC 200006 / CBS 805.95 / DAOM BR144) TaxID=431595 RepID=K3WVK7_GLOUD